MTHGGPTHLTLHVASKDVLDPTTATLSWVAETMADLDYLYNIFAVPDLVEQGRIPASSLAFFNDSLMAIGYGSPPQTINTSIRRLVPPTAQAQLETLEVGRSFNFKFGGLAKVVDALARIFDPERRAAQRAEDHHREKMNRLEEEARLTDVVERRMEVIGRYMDDPRFDPFVKGDLGFNHPLAPLRDNMIQAARPTIAKLEENEIEVLDVEEEPS
jgi:hypothetical protein